MFLTMNTGTRGAGDASDFSTTLINGYQITSVRPYTTTTSGAHVMANTVVTLTGGTTYYATESFAEITESLIKLSDGISGN